MYVYLHAGKIDTFSDVMAALEYPIAADSTKIQTELIDMSESA